MSGAALSFPISTDRGLPYARRREVSRMAGPRKSSGTGKRTRGRSPALIDSSSALVATTSASSSTRGPTDRLLPTDLFDRIVAILEEARRRVVHAVNSQMVTSYWHIGREIVQELQGGDSRAKYGEQLLAGLSARLTQRYGEGFSVTNLRYMRQFYQVYADRSPQIHHRSGDELPSPSLRPAKHHPAGDVLDEEASSWAQALEQTDRVRGFSPRLSWSHYRILSKVKHRAERLFYEIEAAKEGWTKDHLERQIHTHLFARLWKSRDKVGVLDLARHGQRLEQPIDTLREPYVLDFLHLPDSDQLRESDLESAILAKLQAFLLELGKGFAFVARQKRLAYDDEFFYVDLVFYNCILKCYVLIDLKVGRLTHGDVGQMDSYVRLWDEQYTTEGDNPTIGLILCAEKNEAVARYSVLKESKQLFAAKYVTYLPTVEELERELTELTQSVVRKSARLIEGEKRPS